MSRRVLAIDLSTKSGWAILEDNKLIDYGLVQVDSCKIPPDDDYPGSWVLMGLELGDKLCDIALEKKPDVIVIEETNRGIARYTQKMLEYLHAFVNYSFVKHLPDTPVKYIDTMRWRKTLDFPAVRQLEEYLAVVPTGKSDKKWQAVVMVNKLFDLEFKKKDNDIADSILVGMAWIILNTVDSESDK